MTETKANSNSGQATEFTDSLTFQANLHIEKGKQRTNILRGERAKTKKTGLWADKQEVKVERAVVQLDTEKTKLAGDKIKNTIAKDETAYLRIYQPMHRVQLGQQLVKKAYQIGANPNVTHSQVAGNLGASSAEVVNFANQRVSQTVDVKAK
jgi:hypothetical protein